MHKIGNFHINSDYPHRRDKDTSHTVQHVLRSCDMKGAETLFALWLCFRFNDTQKKMLAVSTCGRQAAYCTRAWEQNFEGGGKFIKHHYGDKSQQTASASRLLSIPTTQPNRKARPLRRARYAASPGDRYVTPPKTLWHNYTSVALKGVEVGGRRG